MNTTRIQTTLQTLFQDDTRWVHPLECPFLSEYLKVARLSLKLSKP